MGDAEVLREGLLEGLYRRPLGEPVSPENRRYSVNILLVDILMSVGKSFHFLRPAFLFVLK